MAYNSRIHPFEKPHGRRRRSIRLKGYDYTQPGANFVTVATHRRQNLFGEIINGIVRLNACGETARVEWLNTASIRREIALDEFIVMPNHIHGIITIMDGGNGSVGATRWVAPTITNPTNPVGATRWVAQIDDAAQNNRATRRVAPTLAAHSIGAIMAQYKSIITKRINQIRGTPGTPIW